MDGPLGQEFAYYLGILIRHNPDWPLVVGAFIVLILSKAWGWIAAFTAARILPGLPSNIATEVSKTWFNKGKQWVNHKRQQTTPTKRPSPITACTLDSQATERETERQLL